MPRKYTPRASLICERCGTTFTVPPYRTTTARACSNACRRANAPAILDGDGSARIPLHTRNGSIRAYATVDAADAEWASQWRWSLNTYGYAVRAERQAERKATFFLHRELLGLVHGDGLEGDHIDRDRLNNRRSNLRSVPRFGQTHNRSSVHGSTSKYRGVSWSDYAQAWYAGIKVKGKTIFLGQFSEEHDAAEAARAARLRLMPYAVD